MHQRVLVTTGASGIGREVARAFAANAAKVFVIDAKGLDALSREIGVKTKVCDNSKRSDVEALIPAAVEALGGLDITAQLQSLLPWRVESVTQSDIMFSARPETTAFGLQSIW